MAQLPSEIVSHSRKVCSLYKKALRALRDWHDIPEWRYQCALMRDRFDKNANIKDLRLANHLLEEGMVELKKRAHIIPIKFATSPGGTAYNRFPIIPDWVLDYWHPLEKAQYPKYFETREKRRKEYVEWYYKTYPDVKKDEGQGHGH